MLVCIPVRSDGQVDPRWGRADRVATAEVSGTTIGNWQEFDVGWGTLHDTGSERRHHARVAGFLREHGVQMVVADHMGEGMIRMLQTMGIEVSLGAAGAARQAVREAVRQDAGEA